MSFADLGADVTKVEHPDGGDPAEDLRLPRPVRAVSAPDRAAHLGLR
ncbi:CoA transferase [Rhodococcus rhodochrous]|uniref:CoA transferase n=1 Tax=Rhodococcus rhodochrous TaxID=1829 RepID=A0AAW4XIS3_RHORH|nr:CoA transferase [Rhodococcus rhodochrous]